MELDYQQILSQYEEHSATVMDKRMEVETLRMQLHEAEQLFRRLTREANQAKYALNEEEQILRNLEKDKARALRLKEAEAKRHELLERFNKTSAELDELTKDAKWRGFAYEHQIVGGKRLAIANRGILGDKRGLGKTLTSLIYLDMVQAKKILVIAPNDVVPQFIGEIMAWADKRQILNFAGMDISKRSIMYPMLKMLDSFIIVLNYEAWRRDKGVIDDLASAGIDTIILDEAHRAKASSKQTARGIFQIAFMPNYCPKCKVLGIEQTGKKLTWMQEGKLVNVKPLANYTCATCGSRLERTAKNFLSMTGTPILNKPQELFTMLHLVDPYRFPSEEEFLRSYCYSYGPGRWKFHEGGLKRLTDSMSEFFLQRNRDDAGIKIPPPDIKVHYLEMDPVKYPLQYKAYHELTKAAALTLGDGTVVNMLYILEIILRERQIITWPAGVELKLRDEEGEVIEILKFDVHESQKLDAVQELLEELCEEDERTIVFSKFKAPLYELRNRLQNKFSVTTATGDDPKHHKERVRSDFDLKTAPEHPKWSACFATFDAFATGVNLNAARHVILIDDEWNGGMEDQSIGRIDRLNSTDQAYVHIFRVKGTIDIFMEALIEQKRQLTEGFETTITAKDLLAHLRDVA